MIKIILIVLTIVNLSFGNVFSKSIFKKSIRNMPISKITKNLDTLSQSKQLFQNIPKIKLTKLTPIDKMLTIAQDIANKSPFSNKLMGSKEPLVAMRYYSKYGNTFIDSTKILTNNVSKYDIVKLSKNIPNIPKLKILTQSQAIDKTLTILKTTGKIGWDITKGLAKLANQHKFTAISGVLYGWFLTDPEGFVEALDQFGGNIETFAKEIASITTKTAFGVIDGVKDGIFNEVKKHLTNDNIIIFISIILLWILWNIRSSIFAILNKMIITKVEKKDHKLSQKKNHKRKGTF